MNDRFLQLTKEIQDSMLEASGDLLTDAGKQRLRATIRIVIEFRDYLEFGRVDFSLGMSNSRWTPMIDEQMKGYRDRLKAASEDPFNEYDREYACETILSGVDCFMSLTPAVRALDAQPKIGWDEVNSRESFTSQFFTAFDTFVAEPAFPKSFGYFSTCSSRAWYSWASAIRKIASLLSPTIFLACWIASAVNTSSISGGTV